MSTGSREEKDETIRYAYDLTAIKYAALTSRRHDDVVRIIADDLHCSVQEIRKILMENCDMILIESLAARYYTYLSGSHDAGEISSIIRPYLYTRVIPLIRTGYMNTVLAQVQTMIQAGTSREDACAAGKKMIVEELQK